MSRSHGGLCQVRIPGLPLVCFWPFQTACSTERMRKADGSVTPTQSFFNCSYLRPLLPEKDVCVCAHTHTPVQACNACMHVFTLCVSVIAHMPGACVEVTLFETRYIFYVLFHKSGLWLVCRLSGILLVLSAYYPPVGRLGIQTFVL